MVTSVEALAKISSIIRNLWLCLFFSVLLIVLFWSFGAVVQSTNAETNLHSALAVVDIVEMHVKSTCRWPANWSELEPYRVRQFHDGDRWAKEMQQLMHRVDVTFGYDNQLPSDEEFSTKPPIRPRVPYYRASFNTRIESLIGAIKKCNERETRR